MNPKKPKININFAYAANKQRVAKEASFNIWKGLLLAIFTGFAISVILIFALVPTAAQAVDDVTVGMNIIFILIFLICSIIAWYFIHRSAK